MSKVTKEDLEGFFKEADANSDGFLTFNELSTALKKRGYGGKDGDLKVLFQLADTSGDNKISLEEYMEAMGGLEEEAHAEAALRTVFASFDKDGNGEIDRKELAAIFAEAGKYFKENDLQRMIELADQDKSGTLNYEEFIVAVAGKGKK